MQLLVTGGAGFIGSNFIRYWMQMHPDDKVVNFDALTYAGNVASLQDLKENSKYQLIRGDITDSKSVAEAMDGADIVVHLAAESHVDRSVLDPAAFVRTNVLGTQVLLDAARATKVKRFHHVSTDEVFGSLELGSPTRFNESTPYSPHSPYSASKAGSDMLVRAYYDTYGLPVTISNCSNNYGPYQFPEKLIPLMTINALADKRLPVYGKGENIRDWVHVLDHNRAVAMIIEGGAVGETYCIGGNAERENLTIVRTILRLLGKSEDLIEYVTDRPGHDLRYAIDASKIERELGFVPAYTFEDGIAETVRWYQEHEEWWGPIVSGDYSQYYELQYGTR